MMAKGLPGWPEVAWKTGQAWPSMRGQAGDEKCTVHNFKANWNSVQTALHST